MNVDVAFPEIAGDTVWFRWRQSTPNPYQTHDAFFLRYEHLTLERFSREVFYEVVLALQLRVFAGYGTPVEIVFPSPVPRPTVDFWRAFHDAEHVLISPIADIETYAPWIEDRPTRSTAPTATVFFGGGKDSMLAASLLSEVLGGPERVHLIQYVGPLRDDPGLFAKIERRQESLMLRPARERLGLSARRVWTNYQARFRPAGYHLRPHLELYTAGALPMVLDQRDTLCTMSIDRGSYSAHRGPDGQLIYRYAKSRPEMLETQSRHYQRVLSVDLTVSNVNLPFTKLLAIRLLADRYPAALKQIVMCTQARVDQRWCYACRKCAVFAFSTLYLRKIDPGFDYDFFLGRSPFIQQVIAYAESGVTPGRFGNARWQAWFSGKRTFLGDCHLLAGIDPDDLPVTIGADAHANLILAKVLFGNRSFPDEEVLLRRTFDRLGPVWGPKIAAIATTHLPAVDELMGPHLAGNMPIEYDFASVMPTKTALLPHLRDEATSNMPADRIKPETER